MLQRAVHSQPRRKLPLHAMYYWPHQQGYLDLLQCIVLRVYFEVVYLSGIVFYCAVLTGFCSPKKTHKPRVASTSCVRGRKNAPVREPQLPHERLNAEPRHMAKKLHKNMLRKAQRKTKQNKTMAGQSKLSTKILQTTSEEKQGPGRVGGGGAGGQAT